jgi:hypothetical protein
MGLTSLVHDSCLYDVYWRRYNSYTESSTETTDKVTCVTISKNLMIDNIVFNVIVGC